MADPQSALLAAALTEFRASGYNGTTLEAVARRARLDLTTVQAHYPDKDRLLQALLHAHSPLATVETALDSVKGDSAEDIVRDVMRRMVEAIKRHEDFVELAVIDLQANNGAFVSNLTAELAGKAQAILERIKATDELRPVSDPILARTLVALLIGFVASERMVPGAARLAMRLFPQRAWVDGMVDLLLYGIIEDTAR